jgi:hypothetical protein
MESPNSREFACYQPRSVSRNAKTLGLKHSQLPDVTASRQPPDRTRIIHHRTDELLVKQHTVSDGQAAPPVREGTKHGQPLGYLLSQLVDVCRPGKLCIKCHPKMPCCIDPQYWFSAELDWTKLLVSQT